MMIILFSTVWNHTLKNYLDSDDINNGICQPAPTVSASHPKGLIKSSHNQLYTATNSTRSVIPSKRAAQNRAAQRAFRQRKDKYIKDLEIKSKMMDEWKLELDQLRQQNKELRQNTLQMEKRLQELEGKPRIKKNNKKKLMTPQKKETNTPFLPVTLRAPDQAGYHPMNEDIQYPSWPYYQDSSCSTTTTSTHSSPTMNFSGQELDVIQNDYMVIPQQSPSIKSDHLLLTTYL
ncbi:hypothetical protein BDB01DRAFT_806512 [Pilobolus umbonatus]|nr:hypothetical protein BDB01DRAFT_806512 [Pilobolus umbonatus]